MKMLLSLLSLCVVGRVFALDDVEPMAKKVIELRQTVELLNEDYKSRREDIVNKLKTLAVQKAELESNIRNETLRGKQLSEKIAGLKNQMSQDTVLSSELVSSVKEGLGALRNIIQASLPFKQTERLLAVDELAGKIDGHEVSAFRAANLLWNFFEDERRLAQETNLFNQTIVIDGQAKLSTVAKVGELFIYFKTDDGRGGMAQKINNEWQFQTFRNREREAAVLTFIDSLKKQIRTGAFDLPTRI